MNEKGMPAAVLAKILGVSQRQAEYLLSRKRTASKKAAADYERRTGIGRLSWLYPDEYDNPMLGGK